MKFIIVDGLFETRQYYRSQIEYIITNAEIIECLSAEDAIFSVLENNPDVIISSEVLSFRSGFEMAGLLNKKDYNIPVIIISNDSANAIDAIKNNVFDFLINPVEKEDLQLSIEKAIAFIESKIFREKKKQNENVKVQINTLNGYKLVNLYDLAYLKADGSYTKICFSDGSIDCSSYYLGKIEKMLIDFHFIRVNRSTIVNLKLIKQIDKQNGICELEFGDFHEAFNITKSNIKKLEAENIL